MVGSGQSKEDKMAELTKDNLLKIAGSIHSIRTITLGFMGYKLQSEGRTSPVPNL